jgi:hypothetical protein
MPKLDSDISSDEQLFADFNSPTAVEVQQLISQLQHSHELWYKMINLESWALASTMDNFIPGFWSRFLENRRIALKQFIKQKRMNTLQNQEEASSASSDSDQNSKW